MLIYSSIQNYHKKKNLSVGKFVIRYDPAELARLLAQQVVVYMHDTIFTLSTDFVPLSNSNNFDGFQSLFTPLTLAKIEYYLTKYSRLSDLKIAHLPEETIQRKRVRGPYTEEQRAQKRKMKLRS